MLQWEEANRGRGEGNRGQKGREYVAGGKEIGSGVSNEEVRWLYSGLGRQDEGRRVGWWWLSVGQKCEIAYTGEEGNSNEVLYRSRCQYTPIEKYWLEITYEFRFSLTRLHLQQHPL